MDARLQVSPVDALLITGGFPEIVQSWWLGTNRGSPARVGWQPVVALASG